MGENICKEREAWVFVANFDCPLLFKLWTVPQGIVGGERQGAEGGCRIPEFSMAINFPGLFCFSIPHLLWSFCL